MKKTENLEWVVECALGGDIGADNDEHLKRILAARAELAEIKQVFSLWAENARFSRRVTAKDLECQRLPNEETKDEDNA